MPTIERGFCSVHDPVALRLTMSRIRANVAAILQGPILQIVAVFWEPVTIPLLRIHNLTPEYKRFPLAPL
jgi:hypothetical protein